MKKVAKAILMALGVILVIGAVVVLGVNLYVQSAATHARIERGLSTGLHSTVKIGSLSFMPWYGLKLSGIDREDASPEGDSVEIAAIGVRFQLWNLLRHRVVIKELTVDGAKVSWTQNPEGKWEMPETETPPPATAEPPAENPTPSETPQANPPPPPANPPPPPAPEIIRPAPERPKVTVNHARMRDASFTFYDKNHKPIAMFTGVYAQTPFPTDKLVEGTAAVAKVALQKEFYIEDWKGSFRYTPEELWLVETSCKVGGGEASGALDMKIGEQDSPFAVDTNFSGVGLDRLLTDAGVTAVQASGTISGFVHLEGNLRDSRQARGRGKIVIANGFITRSDLFESLGVLLHTDKFRGLDLEDAHADFHVEDGTVYLDDLALKCAALTLTSRGTVGTDGKGLYLQCRLAISAEIAGQVLDYLLQNFGKDEATGARYVDFPITGSLNHMDPSGFYNSVGKHLSLKSFWNDMMNKKQAQPPPAATPGAAQAPAATPNP